MKEGWLSDPKRVLQAIHHAKKTWGMDGCKFVTLVFQLTNSRNTIVPSPPRLDRHAYYGLVGRIIDTLEPHTECDPAALLVQTLLYFGIVVGRKPHFTH